MLGRNQAAMNNIYQLMTAVTVFVLIYAALRFTDLSLAGLGVFLFAMFRLAPRVSNLNNMVYGLEGNLPHLVRTQRFIDELQDRKEVDDGDRQVPDPVENVSADGVSFSYDDAETVLEDVSFAVERGEFVAFVGPSGAGKSTIVSLLTRMYEPDAGTITANDISIDKFDLKEWREHTSVVRQSPYVFNDTLRYNVMIANRDASEEELQWACEIAQVTEFLDDLPKGYDTQLGDDGVRLSGGQKQRVAIARALLREADLLLLDEATSDLDTNIEQDVHEAIEGLERDRAMVVIAHRLSTVRNADRIYVMDDGEIAEVGSHDELLKAGGMYAELYSIQGAEA
jgi:subfamily B ATP-binding cassette protein MsbA